MKKLIITSALVVFTFTTQAQEENTDRDGFSIGFQLNDWGGDFGIGANISSPEYAGVLTVDGGYQAQYRSNYTEQVNAWETYHMLQVGIRAKASHITDWFEMYGFARATYLLAGPDAWTTGQFGGSGGFGFEFNTHFSGKSPVCYYIELGSHGGFQNVTPNEVSISGGFATTVGLRVGF